MFHPIVLCFLVVVLGSLFATSDALFVAHSAETDHDDEPSPSWREALPAPADYKITLLINPCGANGTHGNLGGTPLGYDCCMNSFGAGEYARIDTNAQVFSPRGEPFIRGLQITPWTQLALPEESFHNIELVDEDFNPIPSEETRRAHDEITIDPTCFDLRTPHPHCLSYRMSAVRSKLRAACSDGNQTVDATLNCYTPDGQRHPHCMQVGYAQTALIHQCGGVFANDPSCGTFLEIHRSSAYDDENITLAETRITDRGDGTVNTTIIPLTYKADPTRILCNYQESRIRIGSMVKVNSNAAACCCPSAYSNSTKRGSFFCPRRPDSRDGPWATRSKTLEEQLAVDHHEAIYPLCHHFDEDKDILMCSKPLSTFLAGHEAYSSPCEETALGEDGLYGSADLGGRYEGTCLIGEAFSPCAKAHGGTLECLKGDRRISFQDEIGKVVDIVYNDDEDSQKDVYKVSFNDGRTHYSFAGHELDLINLDNTYELWFVERNRFENVIKKRKAFRVIWPPCSYDSAKNQFFPYAQLDEHGDPMAAI